jgi:conjugal transfer ATP-binding protein TraC
MTYLNTQVVDNNSVLVIEDRDETIGIGKLISKKEYKRLQKENSEEEENNDHEYEQETSIIDSFKNLFNKKKKEDEERQAYTKWHAKAYTTKLYPSHINLFTMLSHFVDFYGNQIETEIPSTFFSSITVYVEDREKVKKEVLEKTQWNLWQTKSLGDSARFFPEIVDRARESEAINQMLTQGEVPMSAMWSLVVMDDSLTNVQKYGERIKKKFMETNWVLQEETIIPHWVFLYSLPLQFEETILKDHSKRINTLFTKNCAAITPLMTGEKGFGSPVLIYVDRAGQLAGVDIFASETNYNFIVVGSSGSGKSYTMADFFTNYLMTGAKIRVIDVGRSYKHLCSLIGGQYIEFTEEAAMCLNFFTHIELNEAGQIHEDEMQTIVPLVGLMAMQSLDPEDANNNIDIPVIAGYISQAVSLAFEARHRNAGMQDVLLSLEKMLAEQKNNTGETDKLLHSLITALYPFGNPKGEYFKYFNGINNLKFESDFVVLELEEIDSNAHLKSVVLAAIAHMINTEFFLGSRQQRKILAIDEAWSIMDNKIVVRFLETMARRIRKYNGSSGIITQTIGDFYKNKATRAIFDSSATKIFLKQSAESIAAAENKGELNLDKGIITLMSTVSSKPPLYSELLIKQDSGTFFISRLITDKLAHWIYTNHPKDMATIYEIMKEYGISELDAKIIKGYSDKNKTTIEEEFNNRLKEGLLTLGSDNGDENKEYSIDESLEDEFDSL